jgi:hypothetical protein
MAVEFEAVVLLKMKSRKGELVGKVVAVVVAPLTRKPAAPGPSRKDGKPNDVVFVIVGVTLAIVAKASG